MRRLSVCSIEKEKNGKDCREAKGNNLWGYEVHHGVHWARTSTVSHLMEAQRMPVVSPTVTMS